jgi:uncharacterized membrane protein
MDLVLLIVVIIVVGPIAVYIYRNEKRLTARERAEREAMERFAQNCEEDHDAVIASLRRQLQIGPKADEE